MIVRRLYPTAASVEPAPIVYTRAATDVETAELETLIASVLASDGPEERAEALAIAVADPAAALVCYRLLASCATSAAGEKPAKSKTNQEGVEMNLRDLPHPPMSRARRR